MKRTELLRLVEEAGFVFRGRVLRKGAPGLASGSAEGRAFTVEVEEILRSTEVLRGMAGKEVVVMSDGPQAMEEGATFVFFTNVLLLADRVVVRALDQVESSRESRQEVARVIRDAEEQPLRRRVEEADLIVRGTVVASRRAEEPSIFRSEHDPEWWIARVQVRSVVKGKKVTGEIEVLFANSTDIAWHRSPKLHEGVSGVLLLHRVKREDAVPETARAMYRATEPMDLLPTERLSEIERLLGQEKGER